MELFPHQRTGIALAVQGLRRSGGYYLNWDPGLGKTLGALMVARMLKVRRVLVVTNTAGLGVWEREIRRWWPEASGAVVRRDGGRSWSTIFPEANIRITNYEQLRDSTNPVYRNVAGFNAGLIILDESQYAKSPSSQQQKGVSKLARRAKYRLLLSGTPAHNPLDWWAQYRLLQPDHEMWNRTFTAYKQDIAIPHPTIQFAVQGFRPHVVALAKAAMAEVTHVARSEDADVPEPIYQTVPVTLEPDVRKRYAEMRDELITEFEEGTLAAPIALVKFMRLHQITGGFAPLETNDGGTVTIRVSTAKMQVLEDLLSERAHKKVIIACAFRAEIEAIGNMIGYREGCEKLGGEKHPYALTITGDDSPAEKTRKEKLFQESEHPIRLIVQYRAGGTALTLTAAHSLVIYSMMPSVIALRQMLGRVYRIGQTHRVQILPLLAEHTIDEVLWDGLRNGLDAIDLARFIKERL